MWEGTIELFESAKGQSAIFRQCQFAQGSCGPATVLVGMKHGQDRQEVGVFDTSLALGSYTEKHV